MPEKKLLDETQFSNPKPYDYNFEDDLKKLADKNDIYDELVPYLPTFVLHKNGKNAGRTSVPIITRKMPSWSTPSPRQKYVEPYGPFSAKFSNSFQRSALQRPEALTVKPVSQSMYSQLFPQRQCLRTIYTAIRLAFALYHYAYSLNSQKEIFKKLAP
ncbi:hypothetical protein LOAG_00906 [Loa loa]|uniref:Uncharacterized protein n=1 Tax=Loa loa TaxID=7209 RepID=A0A1S0UA68_LOALO|nr:hypothetical protein LOAG_00906 [Loa loa]EFO27587.2 hypothetical protein LOAG_00906 [Loa loa]